MDGRMDESLSKRRRKRRCMCVYWLPWNAAAAQHASCGGCVHPPLQLQQYSTLFKDMFPTGQFMHCFSLNICTTWWHHKDLFNNNMSFKKMLSPPSPSNYCAGKLSAPRSIVVGTRLLSLVIFFSMLSHIHSFFQISQLIISATPLTISLSPPPFFLSLSQFLLTAPLISAIIFRLHSLFSSLLNMKHHFSNQPGIAFYITWMFIYLIHTLLNFSQPLRTPITPASTTKSVTLILQSWTFSIDLLPCIIALPSIVQDHSNLE